VAFEFSEFLLESISSRLRGLLLPGTRGEERIDELLVGDSSFRGAVLFSSKVCRADVDADGHLMFLPGHPANVLRTDSINLEMTKTWLFHYKASETFSTPRHQ
jgi:hypothetical protein